MKSSIFQCIYRRIKVFCFVLLIINVFKALMSADPETSLLPSPTSWWSSLLDSTQGRLQSLIFGPATSPSDLRKITQDLHVCYIFRFQTNRLNGYRCFLLNLMSTAVWNSLKIIFKCPSYHMDTLLWCFFPLKGIPCEELMSKSDLDYIELNRSQKCCCSR